MSGKSSHSSSQSTFFTRIFRSFLSVIILTAFVLGISFLVKSIVNLDPTYVARLGRPLLSKLNIDEDMVGEVAGTFAKRISQTSISVNDTSLSKENKNESTFNDVSQSDKSESNNTNENTKKSLIKAAIMSDSESDFASLEKGLLKAAELKVDKIFFIGDLTSFGEIDKLKEGKALLDSVGLPYFVLPGDHDLAASEPAGTKNFLQVFDITNQTVTVGDLKIVLFDNSKNFTPLTQQELDWFAREVKNADFVLLSQPLYHPTIRVLMGIVDGKEIPEVKPQADELLNIIRGFDVKAVIAGDQHIYSQNVDNVKPELTHYVTGALQDTGIRNPDGPNIELLEVFDDGSYTVKKIEL